MDVCELGPEIAAVVLAKGTNSASAIHSESIIENYVVAYSKDCDRNASELKSAIRAGFVLEWRKVSEDRAAGFDFRRLIDSGVIPSVNRMFYAILGMELNLPNHDVFEIGLEIADMICLLGNCRAFKAIGLIRLMLERCGRLCIDAEVLKLAIEAQFVPVLQGQEADPGFDVQRFFASGVRREVSQLFQKHFGIPLDLRIPGGMLVGKRLLAEDTYTM